MIKITTHIAFMFLFVGFTYSQQLPQVTQYLFNNYSINPAVAGTQDRITINSVNRYQWEGIVDAPRTYTLSFQSQLKNERSGVGVYLYTDIVGPTRRIGFQGSYGYQLRVSNKLNLSIALSSGIMQFAVDGHKIQLEEGDDIPIQNSLGTKVLFDAKVGLYLYSENFFFGASVPQIAQNKLSVYEGITESESFLSNHFYINSGYTFNLNSKIDIEPSVLVKYVSPVPVKVDANLKVEYQNEFWLAGGWRSNDAITMMFGYNWNDNLIIGYGHDFTTGSLKNYSGATHEILLGIKLGKKNSNVTN